MKLYDCAPPGAERYENPILLVDLIDPEENRVR